MRIDVVPNDRVLHVFHGSKQLAFRYNVWTVLNNNSTEAIFGPTNEFLATLDESVQDEIFELYERAEALFMDITKIKDLKIAIQAITTKIMSLVSYTEVAEWCFNNAKFYVDPPQPVLAGKHPPEMTYTEKEMFDLRCLCVGTKILTPIIGNYVIALKDEVNTAQKERVAAEIVSCTSLSQWPPYLRFESYISVLAHRRQVAVPMALRFGAAKIDLDRYLLGMSIVRRFAIARLRSDEDGSIIAYIFTFLEDKIKGLGKDSWRDKFENSGGGGNDSEADSNADQYRVPEEISMDFEVSSDLYFLDRKDFHRQMGLDEAGVKRAAEFEAIIKSRMAEYCIVPEIHYLLTALVIKDVIDYPVCEIVSLDALTIAISAACVVYEKKEHHDIVQLLLTRRREKDPTQMNTGAQANQIVKRLTHNLEAELSRCYPFCYEADIKAKTNPGKKAIDALAKIITAYEWPDMESITEIRQSIAAYIISIVPESFKIPRA